MVFHLDAALAVILWILLMPMMYFQLQVILEQYGVDLNHFKTEELSTLEVCKDIGHFNGEAWLSDDIQAGQSFWSKLGSGKPLCYVAGMQQWGKVYGRETPYVGLNYMLNKVFVAADTPQGSFDSGMATMLEKSSEEEVGMYLMSLQWRRSTVALQSCWSEGHLHASCLSQWCIRLWGWGQEYCSKCFHILLQMSGGGHVILPSQLTGIPSLAKVVFEMKWEYGPCCLLFRSGEPSCFVPLGMMNITVFGSSASQSQTSMVQTPAVASGSRWSAESSAFRPQASSHSALKQMVTAAKSSSSQASGWSAVPESWYPWRFQRATA